MPNKYAHLLNSTELLDIYGVPVLSDTERQEYFTFDEQEIKILNSFKMIEDAVYFAISLVFFKIKRTFVDFNYRDTTSERQHIMERYFTGRVSPKSFPKDHRKIARLKNKALELCGYQRSTGGVMLDIKKDLLRQASIYPRQRQLCKALLDSFIKHRIAIPAYTTIQTIVTETWNEENERVSQTYLRYTNKKQRELILSLLDKTDNRYHVISIKQEMKGFN